MSMSENLMDKKANMSLLQEYKKMDLNQKGAKEFLEQRATTSAKENKILLKIAEKNRQQGAYRKEYTALFEVAKTEFAEFDRLHADFDEFLANCLRENGDDYGKFKAEIDKFMAQYRAAYEACRVTANNCSAASRECASSLNTLYKLINDLAALEDDEEFMFAFSEYGDDVTLEKFMALGVERIEKAERVASSVEADIDERRRTFRADNEKLRKVQESVRHSHEASNKTR